MRAAVVQINSGQDRERNLSAAGDLVRAAAADDADLVVLPEKWSLLGDGRTLAEGAESVAGEAITAAREWASSLGIHLLAGSFTEASDVGLPANVSVLITPSGEIAARYAKLHMFDVEAGGVKYKESDHEQPGSELVTAGLPELRIGLTICYDLRFPELFRALLDRGVLAFTVPSAFTTATGRDHWEILLRARAIENQAFVLAANQTGKTNPQFDSWGHSMIVGPWGEILAEAGQEEGFVAADLDLAGQAEIRSRLPAVAHRRPDVFEGGFAGGS